MNQFNGPTAKESCQESIFLKFDFSKAYDEVDMAFLF